jgi:hypothetical protein
VSFHYWPPCGLALAFIITSSYRHEMMCVSKCTPQIVFYIKSLSVFSLILKQNLGPHFMFIDRPTCEWKGLLKTCLKSFAFQNTVNYQPTMQVEQCKNSDIKYVWHKPWNRASFFGTRRTDCDSLKPALPIACVKDSWLCRGSQSSMRWCILQHFIALRDIRDFLAQYNRYYAWMQHYSGRQPHITALNVS